MWVTGIDPVSTAAVGHSIEGEGEDTRLTSSWATGGRADTRAGGCSGAGAGALTPLAEDKVAISINLSGAPGGTKLDIGALSVYNIVVFEWEHTSLS